MRKTDKYMLEVIRWPVLKEASRESEHLHKNNTTVGQIVWTIPPKQYHTQACSIKTSPRRMSIALTTHRPQPLPSIKYPTITQIYRNQSAYSLSSSENFSFGLSVFSD